MEEIQIDTLKSKKSQVTASKLIESSKNDRGIAMNVKISLDPDLTVSFDEGMLEGQTVKFWGDRIDGKLVLGLSSGRVVLPVEGKKLPVEIRRLTEEEREYTKSAVLAYVKTGNKNGTIKRTVEFDEK